MNASRTARRVDMRRRDAEEQRIDLEQQSRFLIGGAADHDAIDALTLRLHLRETHEATIEHDRQIGIVPLQRAHQRVIERRHIAVLARRQALEPGFARMHDERVGAGGNDTFGEMEQRLARLLVVDADAAFDGDGHGHGRLHRADAVRHEFRLAHQAGTESAALHALRRAADIEIDLVIAVIRSQIAGGRGELVRIAAAELHGDGMFEGIEAEKPLPLAVPDGGRGHHLGIEPRPARQLAMEEAAMPVRPVHHGCDGKAIDFECMRLSKSCGEKGEWVRSAH